MKVSTITATFNCDIEKVWNIVTDNKNYQWRSAVERVEIIDELHFVEYFKQGYSINFEITAKIPFEKYAFKMDSKNSEGEWLGLFASDGVKTTIEFTEKVRIKNPLMRIFMGYILKKDQKQYITDLTKILSE